MNFEPQKFFIGVIDFFSVLLPGALLTFLVKDHVGHYLLPNDYPLTGTKGWLAFFFSSYLLGHFIFLLGSWLLDDQLHHRVKRGTTSGQITRLSEGKKFSTRFTRYLANVLEKWFFGSDHTLNRAARIKDHYLDPLAASSTINAFQWCKARLTIDQTSALATVQRFEADSKFFRSLVIVLCLIIPLAIIDRRPLIALAVLPLLAIAYWRYVDQRTKATKQACWYVITNEAQRSDGYRQSSERQPSHAGGAVYCKKNGSVTYLLVRAKRPSEDWVLPKGHIKAEESMREAAVREVCEETGVWARVVDELSLISFDLDPVTIQIQFYLMEMLAEGRPEEDREHKWLPFAEALKLLTHEQSRGVLKKADEARRDIEHATHLAVPN